LIGISDLLLKRKSLSAKLSKTLYFCEQRFSKYCLSGGYGLIFLIYPNWKINMMRLISIFSLLLLLTGACAIVSSPTVSTVTPAQENADLLELQNSALVDVYDPKRDPAEDLKQAIIFAQRENKRIMLELGGDWCIWCKYLDEFYESQSDILQFRIDNYVLMKVNVGPENMNERFLSQYPVAVAYPHIYILDSDGTFLHSQDTAELENGADSYVPEKFMAFLQKWAPTSK
jgi:thiol:disulfide interchange protein